MLAYSIAIFQEASAYRNVYSSPDRAKAGVFQECVLAGNKKYLDYVRSYLTGDRQVEHALYQEVLAIIRRLIAAMEQRGAVFADRDSVIADIVYAIMVEGDCRVLRAYRGDCKLSTYLWSIIRHKIIDAIRSEVRREGRFISVESLEDVAPSPTHSNESLVAMIEEHIAGEKPMAQFIKLSKWIEGMDYQHIIEAARQRFPDEKPLNTNRIAYVLHTNRCYFQKKIKNMRTGKRPKE